MVADYETLLWNVEDHVLTITLNRPEKKNAISARMFAELRESFERAGADDDLRCVVLTGAGDSFCSGADLTDPENMVSSPLEARDRMASVNRVMRTIVDCPKPTIARVTGIAAGGGCNLALCCDLVVASTAASFAELFVKRGLVVDMGGSWALTRLLPLNKAKELAMLGDTLSAVEADRLGLVNRLCEPGDVDVVVKDLSSRLAALPPRALSFIKANLNAGAESSIQENLDAEAATQTLLLSSEDTREAILSWIEKREPKFTGR